MGSRGALPAVGQRELKHFIDRVACFGASQKEAAQQGNATEGR